MELTPLTSTAQLNQLVQTDQYTCLFKHNTNCPISRGVRSNLMRSEATLPGVATIFELDLHQHRDLSNEIADRFGVPHQSPQLLVVKGGQCVYTEWGYDISMETVQVETK